MGEVPDVTAAVTAALLTAGYHVRQVRPAPATHRAGADRFEADLDSPEGVRELHRLVAGRGGEPVAGLVSFLGLAPGADDAAAARTGLRAFHVAKEFAADLRAAEGGGWFVNVTGLGGRFGLDGVPAAGLAGAGTLGIAKTLRREYPGVTVKAIDVDPAMEASELATRVLQELAAGDDLVEVGLNRQGRWRVALRPAPMPCSPEAPVLDPGAVVLVTGGAGGVTAAVSRALATARPRLVLVGRTALAEEAAETRGLESQALRARLTDLARARGGPVTPADVERAYRQVGKLREAHATLAACRAAGAAVEYHALDVRDPAAFGGLIDDLYRRFGRIDGVVHGAGVIEDKRLADKTPESFGRVFGTKVDGALTLARRLRPEGLKFLAFFGSVAGRFGNAGQADYSAANEFLNKLAGRLARDWPARVVTVNWGPWDGGMVSEGLRRLYAAAGLRLIDVADGAAAFLDELRAGATGNEVVVAWDVERMAGSGAKGA